MDPVRTIAMKFVLGAVTLLLLISQIGFVVVPLLAPAHVWAAKRSSRIGRLLWTLLPALGLAAMTWAAIYVTAGETKPAIWLLPAVTLVAGWFALLRVSQPRDCRPTLATGVVPRWGQIGRR